jgi:sugar/nucleoside kinase (ribokinase family)
MAIDVLLLNTAVTDYRHETFTFVDELVGKGGLAKCPRDKMPNYTQQQYHQWIQEGRATAGGPGNCAPLIARAGLQVAIGVNLGKGQYEGLDAQGRFFYDVMMANHIDMSATRIHPVRPTGTTFIHEIPGDERGGIVYFSSANDDFDFDYFQNAVKKLLPRVVYYMYSGLSDRGDANGGKDLAQFIRYCREQGCVTIVDSHTLTGDPQGLIQSGQPVAEYRLLEPLLPELDIFFTSSDEARMIENTLEQPRDWNQFSEQENNENFLRFLTERFWQDDGRTRWFGVTVSDGAYGIHRTPDGKMDGPAKVVSRFMAGEVVDLVGAGDSFRAGLISYIARNLDAFRKGSLNFNEAIQMGNLFASLYIKAPLDDVYGNIRPFDNMLKVVRSTVIYPSFAELIAAIE